MVEKSDIYDIGYDEINKDELIREIIHESKNSLSACEGFIQFMLIKNEFNAEYLKIIQDEIKRTLSMLNSYALISPPLQNTECDINSCVAEICTLISYNLKANNINLDLHLSDLPLISVDKYRIKQVLLNIIENSIQSIEKNGVIKISTLYKDGYIIITIEDNGCGMDKSIMDRIFEPLFTTKPTGTGLGLHVCKNIINNYNGNICLESTPKKGTKFLITLPVASS